MIGGGFLREESLREDKVCRDTLPISLLSEAGKDLFG